MKDKLQYLREFNFGLNMDAKQTLPDGDVVYENLITINNYFHKLIPMLVDMEKTIESQQIEIEKLKKHVSSRVQKIEIVKFLDQTETPKPTRTLHDIKWPSEKSSTTVGDRKK